MKSSEKNINILLDLDQTLISAEALEEYDSKNNKKKSKKFKYHNMDGYYIVFERPGLQDFLTYLFENFNVSIWTAATKDYALFIVDKIILNNKPERQLDYIFFKYHCNISNTLKNSTKDLSMLWDIYNIGYKKDNTLIIDDYNEVYKTQPENCIIAKPFEFTQENSENDKFLINLKLKLEKINSVSVSDSIKNINNSEK